MKKEKRNKIVILTLLIILFNFISPIVSLGSVGGTLFVPISEFLTYIADLAMEGLQFYFMKEEPEEPTAVKYSPAIIFSNKVPAFDINFFNPMKHQASPNFDYILLFKGTYESGNNLKVEYEDFDNIATGGYAQALVYDSSLAKKIEDASYQDIDSMVEGYIELEPNIKNIIRDFFSFQYMEFYEDEDEYEDKDEELKNKSYVPDRVMEDRHLKAFLNALFTGDLGLGIYEIIHNTSYTNYKGTTYDNCTSIYFNIRNKDWKYQLVTWRVPQDEDKSYQVFVINIITESGEVYEIYQAQYYYEKKVTNKEDSYYEITHEIRNNSEKIKNYYNREEIYPRGYNIYKPNYDLAGNINKIVNFFDNSVLAHGLNPYYTNAISVNTYNPELFAFLTWVFNQDWENVQIANAENSSAWAGYMFTIDGVSYRIETEYNEIKIYKGENIPLKSSARILQPLVMTWYKTLRAISLVGLLSMLVYVGIRILISSTSAEKAKYKKMIGDWLAAICLLFVLQYIMIFIIEFSNKITEVLSASVIKDGQTDILMRQVRMKLIGINTELAQEFAAIIIYLVLVIYTLMFTVQYLRRVIYMAFFTLIAPLITLTYPLDKMKDSKAQAFSTWIREYIFNALLQPMHLLLYYIFVSSAMELVKENWVYALVAIGFLFPAEKFFRKMFGFDKAETSSQLGAAAGGALAMSAFNAIKGLKGNKSGGSKGGGSGSQESGEDDSGGENSKGEDSGEEDSSEDNNQNDESNNDEGSQGNSMLRYASSPTGETSSEAVQRTENLNQANVRQGNLDNSTTTVFGQKIKTAGKAAKRNIKNGVKAVKGHYLNKANRKKILKGAGRMLRKGVVGAAGAATLGTVGLAAGIATGSAGNAFKYGLGGATAGYIGANALGDKAVEFEKKNREIFKEGALGTEEYNTRNSIEELTDDNSFNGECAKMGIKSKEDKEQLIRNFHNDGIKDTSEIRKAVEVMAKNPGVTQEEVIKAQKIKKQANKWNMKKKDIEESLKVNGIQGDKLKKTMDLIEKL